MVRNLFCCLPGRVGFPGDCSTSPWLKALQSLSMTVNLPVLITGRVKRGVRREEEEKAPGRAQSPSQAAFPCGQMTAQKAGGVKQHRNGHGAFVPSGFCHASLDSMDRSVPELVEQSGNLPGAWPRQLWGGREGGTRCSPSPRAVFCSCSSPGAVVTR